MKIKTLENGQGEALIGAPALGRLELIGTDDDMVELRVQKGLLEPGDVLEVWRYQAHARVKRTSKGVARYAVKRNVWKALRQPVKPYEKNGILGEAAGMKASYPVDGWERLRVKLSKLQELFMGYVTVKEMTDTTGKKYYMAKIKNGSGGRYFDSLKTSVSVMGLMWGLAVTRNGARVSEIARFMIGWRNDDHAQDVNIFIGTDVDVFAARKKI